MNRQNVAAAVAVATTFSISASVVAAPVSNPEPAQRTGTPAMEVPVNQSPSDGRTSAVLRIASVEVIRSSHAPYIDIIRVRGFASSTGWEEAELVPLTNGVPTDGVLHLILVARPPEAAVDASGYEPVEAIFPLKINHSHKGINVHGATNAVIVTSLPGYSDAKSAADDCGKCVGKTFAPKGVSDASGRGDLVREDQLPPDTRIVRPSDGLKGAVSNPNRLTLVLDNDNRIVTAVWE
jgi:hypothetical protein